MCIESVECVGFFYKQKAAYEMRISDWSSDVCSSDLEIKDARIDAKHEFGFVLCERHLFNRRQAKIVTKFGANRPDEMFLHERIPATVYVGSLKTCEHE